jgi:transcriptional regulator with XRE-family HTH domain
MADIEAAQARTFRNARSALRMTQRHLADAARVSVKTVMRAERGDAISDENVRALCAVLSIDIASLPNRRLETIADTPSRAEAPAVHVPEVEDIVAAIEGTGTGEAETSGTTPFSEPAPPGTASSLRQRLSSARAAFPARLRRVIEEIRIAVGQVTLKGAAVGAAIFVGGLYVGHVDGLRYGLAMTTPEVPASRPDASGSGWGQSARAADIHHHQNEVGLWLATSVSRAFSMDFANYRREMMDASDRFTNSGWIGFEKALKASDFIGTVVDKKSVVTAVPTGSPVVLDQGFIDGRYAWRLQMPILLTHQTANSKTDQSLMVTATVVEQDDAQHTLGIAQIIAQ